MDQNQEENFRVVSNTDFSELPSMFSIVQHRIHRVVEKEVFGVNTVDWDQGLWLKTALLYDRPAKKLKPKFTYFQTRCCASAAHVNHTLNPPRCGT